MRPSSSSSREPANGGVSLREPRPARLKINKDSHSIQKSSTTTSASSTTATSLVSAVSDYRADPVIIYTHSPKVIHTEARDFMALVQKLTGMSSDPAAADSSEDPTPLPPSAPPPTQPQSFEDSYNSNVDFQVSCNSSFSSNSQPKDPLAAAANAAAPESGLSEFHLMKADWTDCLLQESPYLTYQEMSEINSLTVAAANGWIHPTFGYGSLEDQDNLF